MLKRTNPKTCEFLEMRTSNQVNMLQLDPYGNVIKKIISDAKEATCVNPIIVKQMSLGIRGICLETLERCCINNPSLCNAHEQAIVDSEA